MASSTRAERPKNANNFFMLQVVLLGTKVRILGVWLLTAIDLSSWESPQNHCQWWYCITSFLLKWIWSNSKCNKFLIKINGLYNYSSSKQWWFLGQSLVWVIISAKIDWKASICLHQTHYIRVLKKRQDPLHWLRTFQVWTSVPRYQLKPNRMLLGWRYF